MDKTDVPEKAGLPATMQQTARQVVPVLPREGLTLLTEAGFARAMRLAEMMAEARGLPGFYNRSPGTCLAAIEDGMRLGISPFVVARMSYQVTPSSPLAYLGKFVTAIINGSPDVIGTLSFEHVGDWSKVQGKSITKVSTKKMDEHGNGVKYRVPGWKDEDEEGLAVIVRGTLKETGEVKELQLSMVQCWPRNSTLWGTDPAQQICYVAARRWADRHAPHVLLGIDLAEEQPGEMIDISPEADRTQQPDKPVRGAKLAALVEQRKAAAVAATTVEHDEDGVVHEGPAQGDDGEPGEANAQGEGECVEEASQVDPIADDQTVRLVIPGKEPRRTVSVVASEASRQLLLLKTGQVAGRNGWRWCEASLQHNPWIPGHAATQRAIKEFREECRRAMEK